MAASQLTFLAAGIAGAQEHPSISERPPVMKALDGNWVMSGDIMGKSVTYKMVAAPSLQGAFTELHLKDVQVPSEYEARVFIGYVAESQNVIVHWMDSFGAKSSIPHGSGSITGNTTQFIIPYEGGPFRDTLTYNPDTNTWWFVIEASQPDGTWEHFTHYSVRRE